MCVCYLLLLFMLFVFCLEGCGSLLCERVVRPIDVDVTGWLDAGMCEVSGVCGAPCALSESEARLHEEQAAAAAPAFPPAPALASMPQLQAGVVHGWMGTWGRAGVKRAHGLLGI